MSIRSLYYSKAVKLLKFICRSILLMSFSSTQHERQCTFTLPILYDITTCKITYFQHSIAFTYVRPHPNDGLNWWFLVLVQGSRVGRKFRILIQSTPLPAYPSEGCVVPLVTWSWSLHSPIPVQIHSYQKACTNLRFYGILYHKTL